MKYARTTIITLALGVLLSIGPTVGAGPEPDLAPNLASFTDLSVEHEQVAQWAMALFAEAGLELPPIDWRWHADPVECHGQPGSHKRNGERSTIDICADANDFYTRYLFLHETAHAWAEHQLSEERKAAFQELRGWEHWRNYQAAPWHENGTEQAAEIMVWGLIDRPWHCKRIWDNSCQDLRDGYVTRRLTPSRGAITCFGNGARTAISLVIGAARQCMDNTTVSS